MDADVVIIGAGAVGLSAAMALAPTHRVVVLERERQSGVHSSGRSAAVYVEPLESVLPWAFTVASRPFFDAPPDGFTAAPLLRPRGGLTIVAPGDEARAEAFLARWQPHCPGLQPITAADAVRRLPALRVANLALAIHDPEVLDIDVGLLLDGYLRAVRAAGGQVVYDAEVHALERTAAGWVVHGRAGVARARCVVNAAGAWGATIGALAGALPVALQPKRRTAMLLPTPAGVDLRGWPMVHDVAGSFYCKPDADRLLLSPADETPSEPCDAQPEELDIAIAVDRLQAHLDFPVRSVPHRWAGLRSFVPDRHQVVGEDPRAPGFFWCVGQGGTGIQTSPAMGRALAAQVRGDDLEPALATRGVSVAALDPARAGAAAG